MGFIRFRHVWGSALAVAGGAALLFGSLSAPAVAEVVSPFEKRYDEALYGDFVTIGNTVMGCPQAPPAEAAECAEVQRGGGTKNNNDFVARPVDAAALAAPAGTSSSARLTVPPGAEVAYARLFWGGNNGTYKLGSNVIKRCDVSGEDVVPGPGEPLATRPVVKVGTGAAHPVALSDMVEDPAQTGGPHYYTGESDVTAAFADVATGSPVTVAVGNIWAPQGRGCVAGWSLTVVYKYPGPNEHAPERRNVYVYGGHVLQRSADPDTTVKVKGFYRTGDGPVRASATAYEGDWNTKGDQFRVNGANITNPVNGATDNFFTSSADGSLEPHHVNNLSIDAKSFDVPATALPAGATSADLTFRTRGDTYVISQFALAVPVPDLEVKKTAAPAKSVAPGDTVTYTITAKNISSLDYPNAKLTDDLTELLDDAAFDGVVTADLGTASYTAPKLSWTGDVPQGKTATITYKVKVNDPLTGDGKLTNHVVAESGRTNCEQGSKDPACTPAPPVITPPDPSPSPSTSASVPPSPSPSPSTSASPSPSPSTSASATPPFSPSPTPSTTTQQPRPLPVDPGDDSPGSPGSPGGNLATTGSDGRQLWLMGTAAATLTALGGVVFLSVRRTRRR
ncbi:isopeptide-forming domain-containing fimbrial protein [Streptomyces sp. G1]|uniref:DUF7927 domain-containing protein n=1 Tax=Streptomyces sp. G1 TaxID=361572 RepID=UPI00202FA1D1|nr:isopeptide-forming domain-containing fimbrial protein [Streptomyces sp. G1]MCM1970979.1 DUF11 domain-containing protein [Streptomyces sp. G1]